ncbi:hypothetical protein J4460_04260 [Candidatus Woesearchaeota archaeon]|nr:hypothetical protein [Candidatus Woesearchaeota archaeon]HIH37313.1 hypothetical protein [Candidatus Woesearchaeota archaeon]HIH48970.1 hypothetical protein [Candidatus Woesearchaeota archaeon]HIJ03070.1 hypothetical protein [Candidatus Woesearchaeota archaeon]
MEKSTAEITVEYIKDHPHIKSCLKLGLINYSSLARMIAKDLNIEKKTSKDAILIAARRCQMQLKKEKSYESHIQALLTQSEIQVKNRIVVLICAKNALDILLEGQMQAKKEQATFYLLEGSENYIVITQETLMTKLEKAAKNSLVKKQEGLALITYKTPKDIEMMPGVIAYLASLFSENGVNIVELLSCWTDTLFIIDAKDTTKVMGFLQF